MKRLLKVLAGLLVVLLLGLAVLWFVGGQTFANDVEVRIDASPETVFPYLTEPELLSKWMGGVVEMEPLTEGGHRVGGKARVVVEENGERFSMTSEVLRTEDAKSLEVRITNDLFEAFSAYNLESNGETTTVKQNFKVNYYSWTRFFAPFLGGGVQAKLEEDVDRLKKTVEAANKTS